MAAFPFIKRYADGSRFEKDLCEQLDLQEAGGKMKDIQTCAKANIGLGAPDGSVAWDGDR